MPQELALDPRGMTTILASIIALFAACGVASPTETSPEEIQPPKQIEEDQHFCCFSVSTTPAGKPTGEGCVTMGAGNIDSCAKVIYCGGDWIKDDGKVTCL